MPVIALGDLVIALAAVLLILGGSAMVYLSGKLIPNLPLIGGALRSAVQGVFRSFVNDGRSWANGAAVAMAFVVQGTALSIWWACYFIDRVATVTVAGLAHGLAVAQQLYNQAVAEARTLSDQAISAAQGLYNQAIGHADTLYNEAVGVAGSLYNQAVAYAQQLYNQAIGHADDLYNQAVAHADSLVGPIMSDISTVESALEGNLSVAVASLQAGIVSAEASAVNRINSAIAQADATAQALASTAAAGIASGLDVAAADVLNPVLDDLLPALETIAGSIPATVAGALGLAGLQDITSVTGIKAALGLLTGAVAATAVETAECVVPNCDTVNGLRGLTSLLGSAAVTGAIIALLVEAAEHPDRAVSDIDRVVGQLAKGTATAVRDLLGV